MIYYHKIKQLFESSGLSYRQLHEKLGVHWVTLYRLANARDANEYNISLKVIDKICTFFKVKPGDILDHTLK